MISAVLSVGVFPAASSVGNAQLQQCAAILEQGIYERFLVADSSLSQEAFHTTMCNTQIQSVKNIGGGSWGVHIILPFEGIPISLGSTLGDAQTKLKNYQNIMCTGEAKKGSVYGARDVWVDLISPTSLQAFTKCLEAFDKGVVYSTDYIGQDAVKIEFAVRDGLFGIIRYYGFRYEPASANVTCDVGGWIASIPRRRTSGLELTKNDKWQTVVCSRPEGEVRPIHILVMLNVGTFIATIPRKSVPKTALQRLVDIEKNGAGDGYMLLTPFGCLLVCVGVVVVVVGVVDR
ncbi:unnamed protein product [Vitrella brassicaformis CCMP3155]|uniref:Uncharacterized protein n=2 Tax=Vitrella brassicaformis TaxID=1169539 RepID=A0A0G4FFF4_VITBC|nr:unnamed protein product [Vitrella brassicaformis CCMP3155]|eukprot:CEM11591.1 unnamed protein product [Vitrella brassicaformis CCMP3155]